MGVAGNAGRRQRTGRGRAVLAQHGRDLRFDIRFPLRGSPWRQRGLGAVVDVYVLILTR